MKSLEERLRDAYRGATDTVRPEAIRALPDPGLRSRRRTASAELRRGRMFAPLAAAAATATVAIAAAVVVPALTAHHAQSAGHHHSVASGTGPSTSTGRSTSSGPAGLPAFVVENNNGFLQVVSTATWKTVAQVNPPSGQLFQSVAGAADDQTFVAAADLSPQNTTCAAWVYEFHLNSQGQPGALAQLVHRSDQLPTSIAVSADGSTLGYSIVHCASGAGAGHVSASHAVGNVGVLNIASGQSREWSFSLGEDYTNDMSLSGSGSLIGFSSYLDGITATTTFPVGRLLRADAQPGTVLQRAQILVRPARAANVGVDAVALSPDGRTMYACTHSGSSAADMTQSLGAYDTATGHLTSVLRTWKPQDVSCAITVDPAGGHLLLATSSKSAVDAAKTPGGPPPGILTWIDPSTGATTTLPLRVPIGDNIGL